MLKAAVENYKHRTGYYPERVLVDQIYRNRANINFCKEHGIRLSGKRLGIPKQVETDKKTEYIAGLLRRDYLAYIINSTVKKITRLQEPISQPGEPLLNHLKKLQSPNNSIFFLLILIFYLKVEKKSVPKFAYMGFVQIFCQYFD